MKKYLISIALIGFALALLLPAPLSAQETPQQRSYLQTFAERQHKQYRARHDEALRLAEQLGIPTVIDLGGRIAVLDHFHKGRPIYIAPDNLNSLISVSADQVKTGGITALNLTGNGQTLAIWDGGEVRLTHQEFGGRVTWEDDTNPGNSQHSTHVAGTMIAAGVDASAQGFSSMATLRAYDSSDDLSEMANAILDFPIRVSNHSYGILGGWEWDNTASMWRWYGDASEAEDWVFGAYDDMAQDLDDLTYNAPYYLVVRSAGNDRNDTGPTDPTVGHFHGNGGTLFFDNHNPDGGTTGFDCLDPRKNAKNPLIVGAVADVTGGYSSPANVTMSGFSSWGPTDDGRIKPDVSANGVGLYSCDIAADDDYDNLSGTSMASPSVAGSVGMLLEHWENLNSELIRAASMKGLLINTADETGPNPGPDYMFGWGLVNVRSAARLITTDAIDGCQQIIEGTVEPDETYTYEFHNSGEMPLQITLVWHDPPSPDVNSGDIDPAGVNYLVNDLDLRIEFEDGTVFFPWILDPANPANAATTGDNTRDNVEQILISAPDSGLYEIRVVSPAGASTQDFSLILQGNDAIENRYISNAVLLEDTLFTARNLVEFGPNVMIGDTGIVQAIGGHCVRLLPGVDIVPVESGMFRAYIQKGGLCAYYDDAAGADLGGPVSGLSVLDLGDDSAGSQSAENGQQEISEEVELEPASIFQVFPNPATDRVFFRIELQEAGAVDLVVYDEMGRSVHQMRSDGYTPAGTLNYELSLSQLDAGMYYCVLSTERDRLVEKLVVLRR